MKKLILLSIITTFSVHTSFAQEKKQFEVRNFKGMVRVTAPANLVIQGYDGNAVILEAEATEAKVPEKAAGLKVVTAGGLDNTGLAARVEESTAKIVVAIDKDGKDVVEETKILSIDVPNSTKLFKNYVVKVPKNTTLKYRESSEGGFWNEKKDLLVSGLSGELDVNCSGCNIMVSDFSGNIVANNSWGGKTIINFDKLSQDRISSIYCDDAIEVVLPSTAKANLKISSQKGNVYTDFDLEKPAPVVPNTKKTISSDSWDTDVVTVTGFSNSPARVSTNADGRTIFSGSALTYGSGSKNSESEIAQLGSLQMAKRKRTDRYDYTINGGGVYLNITSASGNVYLRKK